MQNIFALKYRTASSNEAEIKVHCPQDVTHHSELWPAPPAPAHPSSAPAAPLVGPAVPAFSLLPYSRGPGDLCFLNGHSSDWTTQAISAMIYLLISQQDTPGCCPFRIATG